MRHHPRRGELGASAVEYALIVTLIAIVIIGAVTFFGGQVSNLFSSSCGEVASATGQGGC